MQQQQEKGQEAKGGERRKRKWYEICADQEKSGKWHEIELIKRESDARHPRHMAHTKAQMNECQGYIEARETEIERERVKKTHANNRETDAEMNIKYLVNNAHVWALTHTHTHSHTRVQFITPNASWMQTEIVEISEIR